MADTTDKNIVVVGDIHGKLNGLKALVDDCIEKYGEDGYELYCTGDIMGGEQAYETLQYIRSNPNIKLVLGNRDDAYIANASNSMRKITKNDSNNYLSEDFHGLKISGKVFDRFLPDNGGIETAKEIFNKIN
ncbi:MAG: metallophosphoesterase, partial [Christensenellaceae bacterium]|nr:metallophosphoesterase [Christensenellaceae bacterium]